MHNTLVGCCVVALMGCGESKPGSPLEKGKIAFAGGTLALGMPKDAVKKAFPAAFDSAGKVVKGPIAWNGMPVGFALRDDALVQASLTFPSAEAARTEVERRWGPPSLSWKDDKGEHVAWRSQDEANPVVAYLVNDKLTLAPWIKGWLGTSPSSSTPGSVLGKPESALATLNGRRHAADPFRGNTGVHLGPYFVDDALLVGTNTKLTGVELTVDGVRHQPVASKHGEQRVRELAFFLTSCDPLDKAWTAPARADGDRRVWHIPVSPQGTMVTAVARKQATTCMVTMSLTADKLIDREGRFWFEGTTGWLGRTLEDLERAGNTLGASSQEGAGTLGITPLLGVSTPMGKIAGEALTVDVSFDRGTVCGWQTILNVPNGADALVTEACAALGAPLANGQCRRDAVRLSVDHDAILATRDCPGARDRRPPDLRALVAPNEH